MPEISHIALTSISVFIGSSIAGAVGFGFAVTAGPLLLLYLDPQTAVVTINFCTLIISTMVLIQTRDALPLRQMAPITVGGLLGVPMGVLLLDGVNPGAVRAAIAFMIIALGVLRIKNLKITLLQRRATMLPTGTLIGTLIGATGIGGVLLAVLLLRGDSHRQNLRASISMFSIPTTVVALSGYGVSGLFSGERIYIALISITPMILGFIAANLFINRIDDAKFRAGVLIVIFASCLFVLAQEIMTLFQ